MGFLDGLGSALNSSVGLGENTPVNLDTMTAGDPDSVVAFGSLGDFKDKIDQSALRQYVETGFTGVGANVRPRQLEILMQEPDMTVLIKKRMFSSLAANYKPELMDDLEKLFYRASKQLFANKCAAIAAYEQLSKIEKIVLNQGVVNYALFPAIFAGIDLLQASGVNIISGQTQAVLDSIREVQALSSPTERTTWTLNPSLSQLAAGDLGQGTGVIELTMVANVSCTSSVQFNAGSCSLTIEDPYKLMIITQADIDKAIKQSVGGFLNNAFFKATQQLLKQTITQLQTSLTKMRRLRGVSDIRFLINPNEILGKKVRAIFDEEGRDIIFNYGGGLGGIGGSVDIDQGAFEGVNALASGNETDTFKQIISNIYNLMSQITTNDKVKFTYNADTGYVRRKMYLHFANKPIIQPMDTVHVFMSSKTAIDPNTATIIQSTLQGVDPVAQGLNNLISGVQGTLNNISSAFDGKANDYAFTEKNAVAGPDFPMWLWNLLRNDFTRQAAGTHVFAGIIEKATHTYDAGSGKYTLTTSATDNAGYFNFGQINIQPSVEVFNSDLYDPLTPFKLEFDASTGFTTGDIPPLLSENLTLLNSGLVKFKNGRNLGQTATVQNYQALDGERVKNSLFRRTLEDPDGFIYRWKEGIQSCTLLGVPHPTTGLPLHTSPNMRNNPFSGQDSMNVLSLLITGQPYNFNTFMQAAIKSGNLSRSDLLNESGASSFYRGLIGSINNNNQTWGGFIPFKKLVINESAYNFLIGGQFDIQRTNKQLTNLLNERARKFDALTKVAPQFANNPQYLNVDINGKSAAPPSTVTAVAGVDTSQLSKLATDIISLDFQIQQAKKAFSDSITDPNLNTSVGSIKIFGDDVSFDPTITGISQKDQDTAALQRQDLRKRLNYLTQRRLWKVKANKDENLFIVDDSYDKNYDIQAFEQSIGGNMELFKSNYTSVADQVRSVAQILGLEVFADSQGHLQARPPQYNRVPSSVFFDMVQRKDSTGVQIFPPYLEALFINQVKGLAENIEVLEDQIRIRTAALGFTTDSSAKSKLTGAAVGYAAQSTWAFSFVSNENDGLIGTKDFRQLLDQTNPDLLADKTGGPLSSARILNDTISSAANSTINFDIVQRIAIVNESPFSGSEADIASRIDVIGKRLAQKTGLAAPTLNTLLSKTNSGGSIGRSQLDVLNLTNQIASLISERQSALKLFANALKNLDQGLDLNNQSDVGKTVLLPFLNKQKVLPDIIEHMIEDESVDDLGYGSGKRYIIKDNQIINFSVTEEHPPYMMVEVNGLPLGGQGLVGGLEGADVGQGGGNAVSTAWAVDFDLWRMYGFKTAQPVPAPFLSNPDTQCAPYAVFLLNKARKEIFQGEITIVGNEFIQPGEVYYIEDRDLLFYADKVSHSYSYGGSFTTQISLKYGHNPGEYIPTILDIVGKGLYTNKHQADLVRNNRHGNSYPDGDIPITSVVFDDTVGTSIENLVSGSYGDANRQALGTVLAAATGLLTPSKFGKTPVIELRTYFNSKTGSSANSNLSSLASSILSWIKNPTKTVISSNSAVVPDNNAPINFAVPPIVISSVDLADSNKSPSASAFNKAREITATSGLGANATDTTGQAGASPEKALFNNVVDIWVIFQDASKANSIDSGAPTPKDQSGQEQLQKTISAFTEKIKSTSSSG